MASKTGIVSTIATAVSVVIAAIALVMSYMALSIADSAESRAQQQYDRQHADKVYIAEAPASAYTNKGSRQLDVGQKSWNMVYNTSNARIREVWVLGRNGQSVNIGEIGPCTMYALPPFFDASDLFFEDSRGGKWHRDANTDMLDDRFKPMIAEDTGDSPWLMETEFCSG